MTTIPSLTGKELLSILKKAGFVVLRVKGSHHFIHPPDGRSTARVGRNNQRALRRMVVPIRRITLR